MKQYDIGLDLGTTSIIIATQEQGVVFHQPSIGAVDTRSSTILAVGDKALRMVGRVPSYIDIIRPLRDGIIQDHRMTNELIVRFINEVCRSRIIKPRVSVCVPAAITGIEADAVVEAVMAAGARQVFLVDEPVAAALGAGLDIRKPMGCMVIDIGGRLHGYRRNQHGWAGARRQPAGRRATLLTSALPSMFRKNSTLPSAL